MEKLKINVFKSEFNKKIKSIIHDRLGFLTNIDVDIEEEKPYNYIDVNNNGGTEPPLIITIKALDYNYQYRFFIGDDRLKFDKYSRYEYYILQACECFEQKIFELLYQDFKNGKINKHILSIFNRYNLNINVFLEAFHRLEIMLTNKDNTLDILKSSNYYSSYHNGDRYYRGNIGTGFIDLYRFTYDVVRSDSRFNLYYMNDTTDLESIYKNLILDSIFILYNEKARGMSVVYYESLLRICSINKDIIDLITIQNKF